MADEVPILRFSEVDIAAFSEDSIEAITEDVAHFLRVMASLPGTEMLAALEQTTHAHSNRSRQVMFPNLEMLPFDSNTFSSTDGITFIERIRAALLDSNASILQTKDMFGMKIYVQARVISMLMKVTPVGGVVSSGVYTYAEIPRLIDGITTPDNAQTAVQTVIKVIMSVIAHSLNSNQEIRVDRGSKYRAMFEGVDRVTPRSLVLHSTVDLMRCVETDHRFDDWNTHLYRAILYTIISNTDRLERTMFESYAKAMSVVDGESVIFMRNLWQKLKTVGASVQQTLQPRHVEIAKTYPQVARDILDVRVDYISPVENGNEVPYSTLFVDRANREANGYDNHVRNLQVSALTIGVLDRLSLQPAITPSHTVHITKLFGILALRRAISTAKLRNVVGFSRGATARFYEVDVRVASAIQFVVRLARETLSEDPYLGTIGTVWDMRSDRPHRRPLEPSDLLNTAAVYTIDHRDALVRIPFSDAAMFPSLLNAIQRYFDYTAQTSGRSIITGPKEAAVVGAIKLALNDFITQPDNRYVAAGATRVPFTLQCSDHGTCPADVDGGYTLQVKGITPELLFKLQQDGNHYSDEQLRHVLVEELVVDGNVTVTAANDLNARASVQCPHAPSCLVTDGSWLEAVVEPKPVRMGSLNTINGFPLKSDRNVPMLTPDPTAAAKAAIGHASNLTSFLERLPKSVTKDGTTLYEISHHNPQFQTMAAHIHRKEVKKLETKLDSKADGLSRSDPGLKAYRAMTPSEFGYRIHNMVQNRGSDPDPARRFVVEHIVNNEAMQGVLTPARRFDPQKHLVGFRMCRAGIVNLYESYMESIGATDKTATLNLLECGTAQDSTLKVKVYPGNFSALATGTDGSPLNVQCTMTLAGVIHIPPPAAAEQSA